MKDQRIGFNVKFEHRGPKLKYNSATVEQIIADGNLSVESFGIEHIEQPSGAHNYLTMACIDALKELTPAVESIRVLLRDFGEKYHGYDISFAPLCLKGRDVTLEHDIDATKIMQRLLKNLSIARLSLEWLPSFQAKKGNKASIELFASDSACEIFSKILFIRFVESSRIFGGKSYISVEGLEAYIKIIEYFGLSYTTLLRDAYRTASQNPPNSFNKSHYDYWIFGSDNKHLSRAIKATIMFMTHFDFSITNGNLIVGYRS